MLRFIYADDLHKYPRLADSMFRDRADQFATRLNWEVTVDPNGHERDAYDDENPLYVIWEGADGTHRGSYRLLPTTGRTMINDHFTHLMGGGTIVSPLIWECTRFCLARGAESRIAAAMVLGGSLAIRHLGVEHVVGVFDPRMVRVYRLLGASPDILGSSGEGADKISVGMWQFTREAEAMVYRRAKISPQLLEMWFDQSFGVPAGALEQAV